MVIKLSKNIEFWANKEVEIDSASIEQILSLDLPDTKIILTPDFHKGPVGIVFDSPILYPHLIGSDIGCGMRLCTTNIKNFTLTREIEKELRAIFFQGKRNIGLTGKQRESIFTSFHSKNQYHYPHTNYIAPQLKDYIKGSDYNTTTFDSQLGSIGGGNHFVEFQIVKEIFQPNRAKLWGISLNSLVVMIHSGSLAIGHLLKNTIYQDNAINFAYANRYYLQQMVNKIIPTTTLWDAPHNFIENTIHRKGATPAHHSQPVIIPGSMGDSSYLCVGSGNEDCYCSTCHGAGRVLSRQKARNTQFNAKIITRIDLSTVRSEIKSNLIKRLNEESPESYKAIEPIINSVTSLNMAQKVARFEPIFTIKDV